MWESAWDPAALGMVSTLFLYTRRVQGAGTRPSPSPSGHTFPSRRPWDRDVGTDTVVHGRVPESPRHSKQSWKSLLSRGRHNLLGRRSEKLVFLSAASHASYAPVQTPSLAASLVLRGPVIREPVSKNSGLVRSVLRGPCVVKGQGSE